MAGVIIITGGGRGIGAAIARGAAAAGYDVAIDYAHDRDSAEAVAADCVAAGRRALAVRGDVADADHAAALFALVNNAGILRGKGPLESIDPADLARVFAVNVIGAMLCARQAIPRMATDRGGPGGAIVNISSIAATLGSPGEYVHYAASKGALDSFTIGLAKETGGRGIRVNAVQAGTALTDIHARAGNPERPGAVAAASPLGRCAAPEEIADAALYLLSDKASYVNGAVLRVGGGL